MTRVHIREFHHDDTDAFLRLWEIGLNEGYEPVYGLSEVLASLRQDEAVAAVVGDEVIGVAVGRAAHEQGWVVYVGVDPAHRGGGVAAQLLSALERRLAQHDLGKMSALIPESGAGLDAFLAQGFELKSSLRYAERRIPVQGRDLALLRELGGRQLSRGLWEAVAGMTLEKSLLERRLVIPLAQPDLADRYGVVPPRAVMLFGPPGTGKTTFAKAVASRLEWPFVEVFPSRLAAEPGGLAAGLRETFERIGELQHAVVFIDEVEEIAARRQGDPPSPLQGVTNELLKIIPEFRDRADRLLICATNFIRALDPAFLRHGRFDYVIPIGLPDDAARAAIWAGSIPEAAEDIDIAALVRASEGLTPADIQFAARKAAQEALERALAGGDGAAQSTEDYLDALRATRATVSPEVIAEFVEDTRLLART
ncbi:GNAT family N-acetyltransferase [Microbacterium sp. MEC084]|uniref:ATP-binding protein n=1 Tax=unclassified Microbacterium TaxID=2609290 RepID=UPI0007009638|nr:MULTISPECIES: GNAT family N-acetyltransferase [unclassified Microbacterium]KQY96309.1 AAA family ATPase [Microbacterium sp. Root53]MCD1268847.1 GNAT family N-acetyltransferase [Microbacterium sp. MEC084]